MKELTVLDLEFVLRNNEMHTRSSARAHEREIPWSLSLEPSRWNVPAGPVSRAKFVRLSCAAATSGRRVVFTIDHAKPCSAWSE